ncbi:MAG: carboxymuconolactone decarboxylase family protein [Bryobacteraceae bacterium]
MGPSLLIEDAFHRWTSRRQIRYVRPAGIRESNGLLRGTYEQIRRDFLIAPPWLLHSCSPELLAGFWSAFRESLIAAPASRAQREAIAQGVAETNRCPYCADVHSFMLDGAILRTTHSRKDSAIAACSAWAHATRTPGAAILREPPFSKQDAPQMIGTALVFHYLNRMVSVFLGDSPLPSQRLARAAATSALGARIAKVHAAPGESLPLLPPAPVRDWLFWASANPTVTQAFAQFSAAAESFASTYVPQEVRDFLETHLAQWSGEDPGLGGAWLSQSVANISSASQPAAKLALLTALAAYRVDEPTVAAFRDRHPSDPELVALTAWASFAAMRRTASWLVQI